MNDKSSFDCQAMEFPRKFKVSVTPDCDDAQAGRIRVSEDLHVYVNGNLDRSGDGLSPETAVATYEEAVAAINRHDGGGQFTAIIHLASLESEAAYPVMEMVSGTNASFPLVRLEGDNYRETRVEEIQVQQGGNFEIANLAFRRILCGHSGVVLLTDAIGLLTFGVTSGFGNIEASGGRIDVLDADIYLLEEEYEYLVRSSGGQMDVERCVFHFDQNRCRGFAYAVYNGVIRVRPSVSYEGALSGRRFAITMGGGIQTWSNDMNQLPGDQDGTIGFGWYN